MFDNNMRLLQGSFPDVWQKVLDAEKSLNNDLVRAVSNKDGIITFKVGKNFIHDKKNILREAQTIIENQRNIEEYSDIVFYGLGMGYQISAFVAQYPHIRFTIYEPIPEIFYKFLQHADLAKIPRHLIKNIFIENNHKDIVNFCSSFVNGIRSSVLIIDLPAYQSIFPEKRQAFFAEFEKKINERRMSVATNTAYQKRWTLNSLKNLIHVLSTPNILLAKKESFQNKPAIMVASGPSLEDELENLKEIREKGLAYIFSVGTALNTMVHHGIYPHAACTYDPTEENQIICKEVIAKGIDTIPLIFGSTVGYEALEKYPGPKMHMLINQDILAAYYLQPVEDKSLQFINDATTIAVITLQLLGKLGFNPIIMVGQNLAFRDSKHYAAASTYHPIEAAEQELANAISVPDVYGNQTASNQTFIRMRQQLEFYLNFHKDWKVINTTKYGAHIQGTMFQNLDELINDQLKEKVVDNKWLKSEDSGYNLKYLFEQNVRMNAEYEKIPALMEKCKNDLKNIRNLADCGDSTIIGRSYDQFNLSMDNLRNNQFFAGIITPMNRVELESLMLAVPAISAERNPILKAQMMEREFNSYLSYCEKDISFIHPIFNELSQNIQNFYISLTVKRKLSHIKILLVECDGILSDGAVYYSSSGDELKKFNFKDRIGILQLQEKGIQTLLINLQGNQIIENAAKKMGANTIYSSSGNINQAITLVLEKYNLDSTEIAYMGNNLPELDLLTQLGLSFAVKTASQSVKNAVDHVLMGNGGQGVIMEIAELLNK